MPEYTKSDFLGIIREKYPAYSTWDDSLLFAKIMEKYPLKLTTLKKQMSKIMKNKVIWIEKRMKENQIIEKN